MEKIGKRILNFRPLLLLFVGMMSGILLVSSYIFSFSFAIGLSIQIVVYGAIFGLLVYFVVSSILSKRVCSIYKTLVVLVVGILLGMASFGVYYSACLSSSVQTGKYDVTARVDEVYERYDNTYMLLSNMELDGQSVNGNMLVKQMVSDQSIATGDIIKFTGKVVRIDNDFDAVVDGNLYKMSLYSGIEVVEHDQKLHESVKENILELLLSEMNADTAGICFASLFGNKHLISSDTISAFSVTGVGHILAVSGLHIMLFVGLLTYILKKLKSNNIVTISIISAVLLCYNILCGFSPSVVRASIMSIVLILARILGRQYDPLSSLSFAGVIILLFMPNQLFSVGFQMSMIAVFSIITLSKYLCDILSKLHIGKYLSSLLSVTLSVNIGLSVVMINYFSSISITAIISNLLILPIFYIGYVSLIVALPFAFLWSKLLYVPYLIFHLIKLIVENISVLGAVTVRPFGVWAIVVLLLILFVVKYLMTRRLYKGAVISALVVLLAIFGVTNNMPVVSDAGYISLGVDTKAMVVVGQDKSVNVVNITNNYDIYMVSNYLEENKLYKVNSLVYFDSLASVDKVDEFARKYKIENILSNCYNGSRNKITIDGSTLIDMHGMKLQFLGEYNDIYGVQISVGDISVVQVKQLNALGMSSIADTCGKVNAIVGYSGSKLDIVDADHYYVYSTSATTDYDIIDEDIRVTL